MVVIVFSICMVKICDEAVVIPLLVKHYESVIVQKKVSENFED